jgi:hypothetical protein
MQKGKRLLSMIILTGTITAGVLMTGCAQRRVAETRVYHYQVPAPTGYAGAPTYVYPDNVYWGATRTSNTSRGAGAAALISKDRYPDNTW